MACIQCLVIEGKTLDPGQKHAGMTRMQYSEASDPDYSDTPPFVPSCLRRQASSVSCLGKGTG